MVMDCKTARLMNSARDLVAGLSILCKDALHPSFTSPVVVRGHPLHW